MRKPDDSSLTPSQLARVRKEAARALEEAGAQGVLPTPLEQIFAVAGVTEAKENILDESFVSTMRAQFASAGQTIKKAISKVLGLFHASEGLVFISSSLASVKRRFVGFHEAGHGFMPWQRKLYAFVEDGENCIDGETAELFDREANTFASEVLFQLERFSSMAADHAFEIWTPVRLGKQFGASVYASIRQYVRKSDRACAVLVLNMPTIVPQIGLESATRRVEVSAKFRLMFGDHPWKDTYTTDDPLGALIPPVTRRSSGKRLIELLDANGTRHECIAESFCNGHQVFILLHARKTLTAITVLLP